MGNLFFPKSKLSGMDTQDDAGRKRYCICSLPPTDDGNLENKKDAASSSRDSGLSMTTNLIPKMAPPQALVLFLGAVRNG